MFTLSLLSKTEREELLKSQLAREHKQCVLMLNESTIPQSWQNSRRLDQFIKEIEIRLQLAEKLELSIQEDSQFGTERQFGKELALLLERLPERFHNKKVTVFAPEIDQQPKYLDQFI